MTDMEYFLDADAGSSEAVTQQDIGPAGGAAPTLAQILDYEQLLAQHPNGIADLPVFHHFSPGMYARELHIPAGVSLTGKMHRHSHMNFLMAGEIVVWEDGRRRTLTAPKAFVSPPGVKRVGLAITDVIWITTHVTDETDLAKIEAEVIMEPPLLAGAQEVLP